MYKVLFITGLLLCLVSFTYFMLGLMHLEPLWTSAPLFFISIFFTLHCFSHRRNRKEGHRSSR
ncbi:MAG TPA: hypothetical protein VFT51_10560 [Bacillales bacterium]|nr:hypothetical protein [Bacillales bacterium]